MRAASGGATALGVDYGMNRTGIAVSAGGIAPRPLEVVASKPIDALVREVVHRALKERVDVIVVGLPVPPNMTAAQAAAARAAAEEKVSRYFFSFRRRGRRASSRPGGRRDARVSAFPGRG